MNIDLLFTRDGEAGLVTADEFEHAIAGVMFDAETGLFELEFADQDSLELNISADEQYITAIVHRPKIHIGVIHGDQIDDAKQVPVLLINDPFNKGPVWKQPPEAVNSVMAFESFLKRAETGQPIHRDDLGDEESAGSVTGGINPAVLQFAPHLARQLSMEAAPQVTIAPSAPTFGMGGTSGGSPVARRINQQRPPAEGQEDE